MKEQLNPPKWTAAPLPFRCNISDYELFEPDTTKIYSVKMTYFLYRLKKGSGGGGGGGDFLQTEKLHLCQLKA